VDSDFPSSLFIGSRSKFTCEIRRLSGILSWKQLFCVSKWVVVPCWPTDVSASAGNLRLWTEQQT